jgi:hypothetical protein
MFVQDIFWGNFPIKAIRDKTGSMLHELFKHWRPTNPFIIFTGTNHINFDAIPITSKLVNKLKKLEIYLYEPLSLYEEGKQHNRQFFSEFKGGENLRADELDSILEFSKKINAEITVYTCDYNVHKHLNYYPFKLKCFDIFVRNYFPGSSVRVDNNIDKHFICPNWRYSLHRRLIIEHLQDTPGYYSWAFTDPPLILDQKFEATDYKNKKWPQGDVNSVSNLLPYYEKAFCVVANETRFYQPTGNFSEKTINAMSYKRPFICVAPPFTLEYIKKLGFKTFSNWWDESYDDETNHSERMNKIRYTLDSIKLKSIEELKSILSDMEDTLQYNQKLASEVYKLQQVL